ncbi:MAG: hypothetical protein ABIV63_14340, partial [Caldimonas sp.]
MTAGFRFAVLILICGASAFGSRAIAADADDDALSLTSAPTEPPKASGSTKFFVEGAIGIGDARDGSGNRSLRRASMDLTYSGSIAAGWRGVLSDRLDYIRPGDLGNDDAVNSLREAYVTWQTAGGDAIVDLGRVNLRYGPAYGYNPTDFFRDGAIRAVSSLDPFSLRENRMGTVVVRGQRLWADGALSVAYSPKLEQSPSSHGESLDLGATNNRDRGLIA